MRNITIIAITAVLAFATQTAAAAPSREENIGVGSGAIIGAIAAGPVGLIIGAAVGAKIGDTMTVIPCRSTSRPGRFISENGPANGQ